MEYVYVVIELHADCPKILGVFDEERKNEAEQIAYKDTKYWRNVIRVVKNTDLSTL